MEELAEDFYRRSYSHASFLRLSLQKKEALVGCCVLVSCRLRNWPVAMGSITCLLETDPALVGGVYQELLKILDVDVPKTNITDILEAHCREYKLSSADVPEELAESSKDLATRSVALVELAADSWIVTGRHPIPIMMASIFLSWQSLKPTKTRLKYSLNKFCKLSKMPMNKTALTRVAEMKEVLWKLGQELPWRRVGEEMAPDDVLRNVADILQHRYALLRAALQTHEETLQTHKETLGTGIQPSTEDLRPEQGELKSVTGDSDEEDSLAPAAHWGKRMLFAPPCVRHPKIRRVDTAERADVNGDEEISDSEIDSYIRTPQEMRDYVQTQHALLSEDAQSKGE
ncbi:Transcription factor IIIB subunit [Merluccius polli]|uniref:Transcription factor IIIB subunit n=1 Tax=Merluccius polli TaxID=89951 RepID=A0AA47NX37_MERPO|nr:Transcription factor IIIB subunit [Merluccius polli]